MKSKSPLGLAAAADPPPFPPAEAAEECPLIFCCCCSCWATLDRSETLRMGCGTRRKNLPMRNPLLLGDRRCCALAGEEEATDALSGGQKYSFLRPHVWA